MKRGWGGIRDIAENAEEIGGFSIGGAECGALGAQNIGGDPGLERLISSWPKLPAMVRRCIAALVTGDINSE